MISSWQRLYVDLGLPGMKSIYKYTQYSQNYYDMYIYNVPLPKYPVYMQVVMSY